ncbi:hypothetical protein ACMX8W_03740 [Bacillus subtilis]|uniref:hypothetical protein n=1 Tax=Bacillus TaxID=1386 RepID=UPI0006400709|nr:hypothetical protein [Bacillus subtilis]AKI91133.1 hypothetical protein ABA10_03760 [Bacillus subtilis]MBE1868194.1 hypothetical protein [Bacillus subtilis]NUC08249.1 hypothetical protein [Bacillus subtilis]
MKKKIVAGVLGLTLLMPLGAGAAYKSYTGYVLGGNSSNNYTGYHSKETSNQHIMNTVENFQKASSANFWAQRSGADTVSSKYNQKKGNTTKIKFDDTVNKGQKVRLAMENANWKQFSRAFVAGRADFR